MKINQIIFIIRGNNCKEEANKCNHEIKHD